MKPRTSDTLTALVVGGVLGVMLAAGCQLGPKGRAAVVGLGTAKTLDAACELYLADFVSNGAGYYNAAISECAHKPNFTECAEGKVAPRERAVTACEVYGHARVAAAHGINRDLSALAATALEALAIAGIEVK